MRLKKPPDDPTRIWGEPVADPSHTLTYEVKDAERVSMTDDKESKAGKAPEIVAESIEPVPAAAPAQSQAVLDIREAGLTPEEAAAASQALAEENEKGKKSKRPENLAAIASFRWLVLLVLALASVAVWAVDSQFFSHRPYNAEAWGLLGITIVLGLLSFKMFRLPTRAGLAALGWAGTFFIDALYGPSLYILDGVAASPTAAAAGAAASSGGIPAVLPWAGLLTLVFIWVLVAIWRKLGRYTAIDIILGIILFYAALGSLWGPISGIFSSGGALGLSFSTLTTSPDALTAGLPWFLWPMTVMVFFILPLAAFFALWDQGSALRRKGGRHGGNLFLALAFIVLLPYAFLTYDKAVAECPKLVAAFDTVKAAVGATTDHAPAALAAQTPPDAATPAPETVTPPPAAPAPELIVNEVPDLPPVTEKAAEPVQPAAPVAAAEEAVPAPAAPAVWVETAPAAAAAPAETAPSPAPGVDPAVVQALENRLKEAETRLQAAETGLKDASTRLDKAEAALAAITSGLAEARKKAADQEKQLQELLAAPRDLDAAIDQRIQSLPASAKTAAPEEEAAPAESARSEE